MWGWLLLFGWIGGTILLELVPAGFLVKQFGYLLLAIGAGVAFWLYMARWEKIAHERKRQAPRRELEKLFRQYSEDGVIPPSVALTFWSQVAAQLKGLSDEQIEADFLHILEELSNDESFPELSDAVLSAINQVTNLLPLNLPMDMVLQAIVAAGAGESSLLYLGLTYVTGLPTSGIPVNAFIDLLYTSSGGIKVWVRDTGSAVWSLDAYNVSGRSIAGGKEKLRYVLRANDHESATANRQVREVEFVFQFDQTEEKKEERTFTVYHETRSIESINLLNEWVHMVSTAHKDSRN